MTRKNNVLSGIGFFLLLYSLLFASIYTIAMNKPFYQHEYAKEDIQEYLVLDKQDTMDCLDCLFSYIKGDRGDILIQKHIDGQDRYVFTGREMMHMKDVKELYQNYKNSAIVSFVAALVILVSLGLKEKKVYRYLFWNGYLKAIQIFGILLAGIGIYAIADFDSFWLQFHYLFFNNSFFFLDPTNSILVNMVPGKLFFHLVIAIILLYVAILVILFLILGKGLGWKGSYPYD